MAAMGSTEEEKIALDLGKVNSAVWTVGGMMANKPPDMDAMKSRKGQRTDVFLEELDVGDLQPAPQRPREDTPVSYTHLTLPTNREV